MSCRALPLQTQVAAAALAALLLGTASNAQDAAPAHAHREPAVALQPLAQHARTVSSALAHLGQPLPPEDLERIDDAIAEPDESTAVERLQQVLDRHVLVVVDINPESRVKVA